MTSQVLQQKAVLFPEVDFGADRVRMAYGNRKPFNILATSVITKSNRAEARKTVDPAVKKYGRGYFFEPMSFDDGVFARCGYAKVGAGTLFKSTVNGVRPKQDKNMSSVLHMLDCFCGQTSKKLRKQGVNNALQFVLRAHRVYLCVRKSDNAARLLVPRYDVKTNGFIGYSELCNPNGDIVIANGYIKDVLGDGYDIQTLWCFLTSPSGVRKNQCVMINLGHDNFLAAGQEIEAMADTMTYGAWSVMKQAYAGKKLKFNKICKLMSRLTLPMTGSVPFGKITSMAIFLADAKLDGVAYADGQSALNVTVPKRKYKDMFGIDLDEPVELQDGSVMHDRMSQTRMKPIKGDEELIGSFYQDRFACNKGMQWVCSGASIREMIKADAISPANIMFYSQEDTTFDLSVKLQKGGSDVENKVHVFGLTDKSFRGDEISSSELNALLECVESYADSTTTKAIPDLSRLKDGFEVNVMEIPGHIAHKTSLSLQYCSGLMSVDSAYDVFCDIAKESIDKKFKDEPKELTSISQLSSLAYCDDAVWSLFPDFVKQHNVLLNNKVKQLGQALEKLINEFSFEVKGTYAKIVADMGAKFGSPILEDHEYFMGGRTPFTKAELDVYRFPHNASGEHQLMHGISYAAVLGRIMDRERNGAYTHMQALVLKEYFGILKEGVMVVPSWCAKTARKGGGWDYDGDGAGANADSRLLPIAKQVKEQAINFGDPKATDIECPELSIWAKDYVYRMALANPNDPVGVITNRGMGFTSLAEVVDKMSDEDFDKFKSMLMADEETAILLANNQPYTRRYVDEEVDITSEETNRYWKEVLACGLNTRENVKAIMQDAQPITSSVGGRSIDSAKTGEIVFAPFQAFGAYVKAGMIQDIHIKVEEDKETHGLNITFEPINTGFIGGKFIVEDTITRVKNRAGKYACAMLNQFYNNAIASRKHS